ncbi:MAG TPA: tRNA pseudouridine(55) synthase TruB, partial [Gammaproteobacteria bacterium]|nr:tRNA pseudouridine(55) synthase TruB [Gammaproteobacteria bacterium]
MAIPVHGILLLDKPIDITSNRALQIVKRLFNAEKAGHTGSLDPIATGMLPICFGEATKFSQFLLESDKCYYVEAKLGVQTTTGDCEGEVVTEQPVVGITAALIEQVMQQFLGEIEQIPPMFSAIKFQGQPLYKLARRGISIERKSRLVRIHDMTLEHFAGDRLVYRVHCSKGMYVRTLTEDIGKQLGCGAHVVGLRRLMVSPYQNAVMYTLPALEMIANQTGSLGLTACLLPVETAVQVFPAVKLSTAAAFYMRTGQPVRVSFPLNSSLVRLISEDAR